MAATVGSGQCIDRFFSLRADTAAILPHKAEIKPPYWVIRLRTLDGIHLGFRRNVVQMWWRAGSLPWVSQPHLGSLSYDFFYEVTWVLGGTIFGIIDIQ